MQYFIILIFLILSCAYQVDAGPYDNVGATTPFNKANSLDLFNYCDGSDQVADDACITTWINDAFNQGKHLRVSRGTYIYTSNKTLFNGVHLKCDSNITASFKGSVNQFFVMLPSLGTPGTNWSDISIENCGFDMQDSTTNFSGVFSLNGETFFTNNISIINNRVFDSSQLGSMYTSNQ